MAVEFGPRGINVNAVNGGIIESDSSDYFYGVEGMPPLDTRAAEDPQGAGWARCRRSRTASVPARTRRSEYVTGQTLVVDGGLSIVAPPFHDDATGPLRSCPARPGMPDPAAAPR